jgi:hypothetical protein
MDQSLRFGPANDVGQVAGHLRSTIKRKIDRMKSCEKARLSVFVRLSLRWNGSGDQMPQMAYQEI